MSDLVENHIVGFPTRRLIYCFSGGFFTMQHDVEDISPQIHKIYNHVDPVALETMITEVI